MEKLPVFQSPTLWADKNAPSLALRIHWLKLRMTKLECLLRIKNTVNKPYSSFHSKLTNLISLFSFFCFFFFLFLGGGGGGGRAGQPLKTTRLSQGARVPSRTSTEMQHTWSSLTDWARRRETSAAIPWYNNKKDKTTGPTSPGEMPGSFVEKSGSLTSEPREHPSQLARRPLLAWWHRPDGHWASRGLPSGPTEFA